MSECSKCDQYTGPGGPGCCCPTLSFEEPETKTKGADDEKRLARMRERADLHVHESPYDVRWLLPKLDELRAKLDESERARKEAEVACDQWMRSANVAEDKLREEAAALAEERAKREAAKPICHDLRHVCGGCGFRWPERSAYAELVERAEAAEARVRELEEEVAHLRLQVSDSRGES